MVLKTFNLNEEIYKKFSEHCKKHGISMSKRIENFIRAELDRLKIGINLIEKAERVEKGEVGKKVNELKSAEHSFKKYC